MFVIKNVRTGELSRLTSEQFKEKIISETNCKYENGRVLEERTGLRPESLNEFIQVLSNNLIVQKHIFLVTALARVNNIKETRYMLLIDGEDYDYRLSTIIHNYVPVYSVKIEGALDQEGKLSTLSKWFRSTMGRAFSFIDIDYLLININYNKVALIEEKIGKSGAASIGYGQLISYKELLMDVIKNPLFLLFIFSTSNASLNTIISYYNCTISSFDGNRLKNVTTKHIRLNDLSQLIIKFMS